MNSFRYVIIGELVVINHPMKASNSRDCDPETVPQYVSHTISLTQINLNSKKSA